MGDDANALLADRFGGLADLELGEGRHACVLAETCAGAMMQTGNEPRRQFPSANLAKLLPVSLVPRYDGKAGPLKAGRNPGAALR